MPQALTVWSAGNTPNYMGMGLGEGVTAFPHFFRPKDPEFSGVKYIM